MNTTVLQTSHSSGTRLKILGYDPQSFHIGPYGEVRRVLVDVNESVGIFPNLSPPAYPERGHAELAAKVLRYRPGGEAQWNRWVTVYEHHLRRLAPLLDHPYISNVLGVFRNEHGVPVILTPYYRNGNVLNFNRSVLGADKIKEIRQVAVGLSHLHAHNIFHGNVTGANIMIKDDTSHDICIVDVHINQTMMSHMHGSSTGSDFLIKGPEELQHHIVNAASDVYQFAGLMFEICTGQKPLVGLHPARAVGFILNRGHRSLAKPSAISNELWAIMVLCWQEDPNLRPTMQEVYQALLRL